MRSSGRIDRTTISEERNTALASSFLCVFFPLLFSSLTSSSLGERGTPREKKCDRSSLPSRDGSSRRSRSTHRLRAAPSRMVRLTKDNDGIRGAATSSSTRVGRIVESTSKVARRATERTVPGGAECVPANEPLRPDRVVREGRVLYFGGFRSTIVDPRATIEPIQPPSHPPGVPSSRTRSRLLQRPLPFCSSRST